jgi:uncharacterized protein YndB with AHSA1/START domain
MSEKKFSFEINRSSTAPAATLFRMWTDGANWKDWGRPIIAHSSWAQEGDPAPAGVGAIRKVGMWPMLMLEKTVEYVPNSRHAYTVVGPKSPARDYLAEVTFTPNASGGTDVRWYSTFTEGVPGTGPFMRTFLRSSLLALSSLLVKGAEREHSSASQG